MFDELKNKNVKRQAVRFALKQEDFITPVAFMLVITIGFIILIITQGIVSKEELGALALVFFALNISPMVQAIDDFRFSYRLYLKLEEEKQQENDAVEECSDNTATWD